MLIHMWSNEKSSIMKKLIPIFILSLIASACLQEEVRNKEGSVHDSGITVSSESSLVNYVMFGQFFGMCLGEDCVEIYKLTHDALLEDEQDERPTGNKPYDGDFKQLDESKFEMVGDITIPFQLLSTESGIIGTPDAADQGGIYFEASIKGQKKFWLIDKDRSRIPEYLHSFVSQIEEKIDLISN
jgi:hypothetical protein